MHVWSDKKGIAVCLALGAVALPSPARLVAQELGRCAVPPGISAIRPGPPGTPVDVTVGLWVNDLRAIDDARQSFDADLVFLLGWTDPRLDSEALVGCTVPLSSVWGLSPVFRNDRGTSGSFPEVARIAAGGTVLYAQRFNGEFTSALALEDFPFDTQVLEAAVILRGRTPDEVRLALDDVTNMAETLSIADWEPGELSVDFRPFSLGKVGREVAQVNFTISMKRKRDYYIQKIFLPLFLIVVMSWAVFWIDPGIMPAQIGISTSAVLTLIAFLFSLGQLLPRLSYLTRADRFVMGATILVFMAFGEALLTTGLATRDRKATALRLDRMARVGFPLLFAGVLLYAFVL